MTPPEPNPLDAVSTPDLNAERLATLKKQLPDLFTNEGRLNPDELKKLVDPASVSESERYDFRWYGKSKSKREAFTPSRAALVYDPKRSLHPDKANGNAIIEGENLEVLKLLTRSYREQVKCIYIDPPYNTGKDFVYSDDYSEGRKPYWEQTGETEKGVRVDSNTENDGRYHSNWLSMIHSRLLASRYLLKPSGVIFVSIDGQELANLLRVMNEVFGEENQVGVVIWKGATDNNPTRVATEHEYIVCYAKDAEQCSKVWKDASDTAKGILLAEYERLKKEPGLTTENIQHKIRFFIKQNRESLAGITHYDRVDGKGVYTGSRKVHNPKPGGYKFDVPYKDTDKICAPPANGYRYPPSKMKEMLEDQRFIFGDDETQIIQVKEYLEEYQGKFSSVVHLDSRTGSNELTDLFGVQQVFTNPKPVDLIQMIYTFVLEPDDLVLDFFGGSGTTAQAVMELNQADAGNRRYILVQLPEFTDEKSAAHKAGYKRISDITIARATLVIKRYKLEAESHLPGEPQRTFADSLGFKVFTLAKSAFPRVEFQHDPDMTLEENFAALQAYIREHEANFHFVYERDRIVDEVVLKQGFMLDYTLIRRPEFTANEVWLVKDREREALLCLDIKIQPATVDHFEPKANRSHFFICLELALDTTTKWNLKDRLGEKLKSI